MHVLRGGKPLLTKPLLTFHFFRLTNYKTIIHLLSADSGHPLVVQGLGRNRTEFAIFGEYLGRYF